MLSLLSLLPLYHPWLQTSSLAALSAAGCYSSGCRAGGTKAGDCYGPGCQHIFNNGAVCASARSLRCHQTSHSHSEIIGKAAKISAFNPKKNRLCYKSPSFLQLEMRWSVSENSDQGVLHLCIFPLSFITNRTS